MIKLKLSNIFSMFCIIETFVYRSTIEGAVINERNQVCRSNEWSCDNGKCITFEKKCDGAMDCSDGSDEVAKLCSAVSIGVLCDMPKYPDHGIYSVNQGDMPGDAFTKLTFFCDTGYTLEGEASIHCIKGAWSSETPTCKPVDFANCANASADDSELCKGDGTGLIPPLRPIATLVPPNIPEYTCNMPKYPNHGIYSVSQRSTPGDALSFTELTFFCDTGYTVEGETSIRCIKGVWSSETPTCKQVDLANCTNASADSPEHCNGDSTWLKPPSGPIETPATPNIPQYTCDMPKYPNHGIYSVSHRSTPGDALSFTELTFFCDTGYTLEGETSIRCIKGIWSSEIPICKAVDFVNCTDASADSLNHCNDDGTELIPPIKPIERPVTSNLQERKCVLPRYPHHGKYNATFGSKPGDAIPYTVLTYSCDRGYNVEGDASPYCVMGTWSSETPTCASQCQSLKSTSVDFKCYKQHSTLEIPCDQPQDSNSYAKANCKSSYVSELPLKNLLCIKGFWDYVPYCTPECGTATPRAQQLVINGEVANVGEFPWHVGIYDKASKPIEQICGGTIFSPQLVVTAAHCVYSDRVGVHRASRYAVAAGKLYRDWDTPRDDEKYVQKIDVIRIEIPQQYKGAINAYTADIAVLVLKTSFVLNSLVRPVCVNFDYKYDLNGKLGKVAGWGLTAEEGHASSILQTVSLPFVSFQECYDKSPESFKPLIIADKICAGYTNGTALCRGDSGGGLVFPRRNNFQDLHYLYGIVSTSARNEALTSCSAYSYTGFTDLRKHQEWFQDIWSMHNIIG